MQDRNRSSTRMLINRNRIYYWGLAGKAMNLRKLGSLTIYSIPDGHLELVRSNGTVVKSRIVAVAPFEPHQIRSQCGWVNTICIEPESISEQEITRLLTEINHGTNHDDIMARLHISRRSIIGMSTAAGFSSAEFDRLVLGRELAPRHCDARIETVLEFMVDNFVDETLLAEDCALQAGVSTSRFLHLFKENTDHSFRNLRMWKRARRFLDVASTDDSLTCVAHDLGYPDSSHFSHSIRRTFGLQPRSIRHGSRGMQICFGENYAAAGVMAV